MSLTLQQLEFFRSVARNLSFSGAARDLFTSQPYVSNQIRRLETHFGVALFVRSQPNVSLTEAGRAVLDRVVQLFNDIEDLERVVQQFHGLHRGTVCLGATDSVGSHVTPGIISTFHREFPEIVVQARVGNTEEVLGWLDRDEIEICLSPQIPDAGTLTVEPFGRDRLVVIHPASMTLPDPLPIRRFAELPLVAREEGSLTLSKMLGVLADHSEEPNIVAYLSGTTAVNEAVASGLGVSLVPARSAQTWLGAGTVGAVTLEGVELDHQFYLAYAQQRYVSPAARAFISHLLRGTSGDL